MQAASTQHAPPLPHHANEHITYSFNPTYSIPLIFKPNLPSSFQSLYTLFLTQNISTYMSEQRGHVYHGRHVQAQPTRQAVKFMAATTIGGAFLAVSGLTATATVIGLIVATPILVLFSPVLVPAAIVLLLVTAGFLFSGGFGVAAVSALSWIFRYATGKHPMGADQLDYARMKITGTARDATNKAREYGQYVQHKAQEVTQGS